MGARTWIESWPVYRQLTSATGSASARPPRPSRTARLEPRIATADKVVKSVCPYCAVGCGQNVYVKDEKVIQIEGDPDSPVSRGRLCPKGSASLQLTTGDARQYQVLYRRPHGTDWEDAGPRHGDGHDRRPGRSRRRARAGSGRTTAGRDRAARWASPASAAPRWTTKRTT